VGEKSGSLTLWEVATGRRLAALPGYHTYIQVADFSRDGRFIVTAGSGEPPRVWRANRPAPLRRLGGDSFGAALSADGRRVISHTLDQRLEVRNVASGKAVPGAALRIPTTGGRQGTVEMTANDGRVVASATAKQTWVWKLDDPTHERITIPRGRPAAVSGGGGYLVTERKDGIDVWETARGLRVETLRGHLDRNDTVSVTPDGRSLAATDGGRVRLFLCRLCLDRDQLVSFAQTQVTRRLTPAERRKFMGS
jgi:WD40 repeat protein